MTDAVQTALITSVPPTLAAFAALIVGLVNKRQGDKIHVLVNSNLEAVKLALAKANLQIDTLEAKGREGD